MKYFTIQELTATSKSADNTPNAEQVANLENLVEKVLDPIRERYGAPIHVNSGFRSQQVNALVKGAKNSQHLRGEAADITGGNAEENKKLFQMIANSGLEYDQLIDEYNYSWVHVSLKRSGINRGQILHIA